MPVEASLPGQGVSAHGSGVSGYQHHVCRGGCGCLLGCCRWCLCLGIRESPNEVDTGWDLSCVKYGVPTSILRYTSGLHSSITPGPMLPWRKESLWKTKTRTILMSDHNYGGLLSPLSFESSRNRIRVLGQKTCTFTSGRNQGPSYDNQRRLV